MINRIMRLLHRQADDDIVIDGIYPAIVAIDTALGRVRQDVQRLAYLDHQHVQNFDLLRRRIAELEARVEALEDEATRPEEDDEDAVSAPPTTDPIMDTAVRLMLRSYP